ncbi:hsp90 co-chaperone Cdc37-like 1 [Myripristis murdjan]|uniref:Hsp90 co-chaperone Cdc37-like 1 n=1 Tax=Myripristis murdjan TaxID=586833 RepID=A0A668AXX3_9TELE|nr:hsp90 co-chaperone Cdc37-like 1 [Myripristis murdjan]
MMEWLGNGASMFPDEEPRSDPASTARGSAHVSQQLPSPLSTSQPPQSASSHLSDSAIASLCQRQQRCVKASIVSSWRLAEAQDQLCSLGVHGSESLEQERARTLACPTELTHIEQEWHRKESMLGSQDPSHSPVLGAVGSWDVFDKSIINAQNKSVEMDQDKCKTFLQKYEEELRHFGMLRRWDDSQRFLSDLPHLICEETSNYLILWCFRLQQEGKEALMEQVAHQAVVMQFILEMASNSQQDPRGCFRQFFHKAKAGQEGYLDVFHTELEAFKHRVKEYTVKSKEDTPNDSETVNTRCRLDPKEVLESLPPELKAGFQLQDMQILHNVLRTMNPQVAEYHVKRCLEAGLWTSTGRWTKDDTTETDDIRMMETS